MSLDPVEAYFLRLAVDKFGVGAFIVPGDVYELAQEEMGIGKQYVEIYEVLASVGAFRRHLKWRRPMFGLTDEPPPHDQLHMAEKVEGFIIDGRAKLLLRAESEKNPATTAGSDSEVEYVDLNAAAAIAKKKKRTLERWKKKKTFPRPAVTGGKGRASLWDWPLLRQWLINETGMMLPEHVPDRFRRK